MKDPNLNQPSEDPLEKEPDETQEQFDQRARDISEQDWDNDISEVYWGD